MAMAAPAKPAKSAPTSSTVKGVNKFTGFVNRSPQNSPLSSTVEKKFCSPLSSTVPGFAEIEVSRQRRDLSVNRLCQLAGVSVRAYRYALAGRLKSAPREATLKALQRALGERPKPRDGLATMLWRGTLALIAPHFSLDPLMAPSDPAKIAGRARTLAAWCVCTATDLGNAELARAIGVSRQNIKQLVDEAADWRDLDPVIADLTDRIAAVLRGRDAA